MVRFLEIMSSLERKLALLQIAALPLGRWHTRHRRFGILLAVRWRYVG